MTNTALEAITSPSGNGYTYGTGVCVRTIKGRRRASKTHDERRSNGHRTTVVDFAQAELDDSVIVLRLLANAPSQVHHLRMANNTQRYKVITTTVIRPLNDTTCAQSVVADLQPLGFGYVVVGDGLIR